MPTPTDYGLFVLAALVLLLIPGPAVLYIVTRSIDQGRAAGLASVLGVSTGTLIQVAFATVGLSSVVLASAVAFDLVKYSAPPISSSSGSSGSSHGTRSTSAASASPGHCAGCTRRA